MISCFLCTLEAVEKFTGNRRSYEAFNVTENKTWESLEWEVWEFGNDRVWWEFDQIREMRMKRENERKETREIKWEFAQILSSLAILCIRKWFEITI